MHVTSFYYLRYQLELGTYLQYSGMEELLLANNEDGILEFIMHVGLPGTVPYRSLTLMINELLKQITEKCWCVVLIINTSTVVYRGSLVYFLNIYVAGRAITRRNVT